MVFIGTDEQRTRERVLAVVSEHGPVTAAEVGRRLGLTPAAVRRHLDGLADHGAVEEHDPGTSHTPGHRGRGRPARAYVVSDAGHGALEADYDSLAVEVLRYLESTAGSGAVADFARSRVGGLESRYAVRLAAAGDDVVARTDVLVEAMTQDGFAASARPVGTGGLTGVQLCQGHCPVGRVAEEFPQFCDAETEAISRLLGVHVQRLATLAGGAHVCTTFIPTTAVTRSQPAPTHETPGTPDARSALDLSTPTPERAAR